MTKTEELELELEARKMVDGTELEWYCVIRDPHTHYVHNSHPTLNMRREHYELALGIVEGKPVWSGYKHFDSRGECHIAGGKYTQAYLDTCSWNPPKPKTVMVELLIEDVERYANEVNIGIVQILAMIERRAEACRKALEGVR